VWGLALRVPRVVVVAASVFVLVVTALGFSAAQVSAQGTLDEVRQNIEVAENERQELRAAVSEAHSPEEVIDKAEGLGLIEPAGVVVLPAPSMLSEAERG
jgi:cell division protein FtsL